MFPFPTFWSNFNSWFISELGPFSHVGEMLQNRHSCPKDFSRKESGIIPRASDPVLGFSFDEQPDLVNHPGPSPSLMLQALTMSNSNDGMWWNITFRSSILQFILNLFHYLKLEAYLNGVFAEYLPTILDRFLKETNRYHFLLSKLVLKSYKDLFLVL